MSIAPRPHTSPSTSSPPNGSRDQPLGVTGTTSVWPMRQSDGAFGSLPSMRATSERRPGSDSNDPDVDAGALEVVTEEVGAARLLA